MFQSLRTDLCQGDVRALARAISLVENEVEGYEEFLQELPAGKTPITGITGPPGAGKSTLVDALIGAWVQEGKKLPYFVWIPPPHLIWEPCWETGSE